MSNLYRAYSAVHSSEISDQLNESRDIISDMEFTQMNSADLQEVAEEIIEEMFVNTLTVKQSKEIVEQIINEALNGEQSELRSSKVEYIKESFDRAFYNCHTEERFTTYRHSKKVQENFHNISNEDLGNKRLHEALIAQEKKTIKEGILSLIEKKTKDSSYLETNMEKRQKNNEKARKDMENMGTTMKNPQLEEFSQIRQDWSSAYSSMYEEKMDAVGKEDGDIDNDGDKDSSDDYLANRRKAIGKSMGKKGKCEKCGKDPCECDKKEVEEGYKELPKNKMFRKAGNLGREVVSPSTTDEKRQKSYDRSKKIVKTLNKANEEVQQVDEILAPVVAGTVGAVTGKKGRKVKKAIGAGTGAAVGGALFGGPVASALGAVAGGLAGGAISDEVQHKGTTFSETELKKFEEIVNSWVD